MERNCKKRDLHEELDSSSDKNSLATPSKLPYISMETESSESTVSDPSPVTASLPEASDTEKIHFSERDKHGLAILAAAASKVEQHEETPTKPTPDSPKSSEKEINFSPKKISTTAIRNISNIEDNTDGLGGVSTSGGDSDATASAKALKKIYMEKYASVYSEELLFAIDVMTLVRHLNFLPCKWIVYVTSGEKPKSPCTDLLKTALEISWKKIKDVFGDLYEKKIKTFVFNYRIFQNLIINMAENVEKKPYSETFLLLYCVGIAHWAVLAEQNGIRDAQEFIPLVLCRTIQKLKDAGKIPPRFWERIAENAAQIIKRHKSIS